MKYQKRLNKARERLRGVLRDVSPESADNYDIEYRQIDKYWHGTLGGEITVKEHDKDYPAYEFYLTPKNDPNKSFKIMHLFGSDLRQKLTPVMEKYEGGEGFGRNIKKGLKEFEGDQSSREKPSRLENLGIIAILCGILGIFFLFGSITGNSIANLSSKTTITLGIGLFFVFLITMFLLLKKKFIK